MRQSPGPLHSLTVYDFQVTVMFAIAMGCDVWVDWVLCSLNVDWGSSSIWHKLSCVSTTELIGWAPKADPREILILTGKQLKGKIGAVWIRHLCACDALGQAFSVTWFNGYELKCSRWRPFLRGAGDYVCGTGNIHWNFQIDFSVSNSRNDSLYIFDSRNQVIC